MREGESGKITDLLYVYDYLIIQYLIQNIQCVIMNPSLFVAHTFHKTGYFLQSGTGYIFVLLLLKIQSCNSFLTVMIATEARYL